MKLIQHSDIVRGGFGLADYYNWAREIFKIKKECILPPKISMKPDHNIFFNVMPSMLPPISASGVKMVTRYPEMSPSLRSSIMLYDLKTGIPKAMMDGNLITAYRTAAVAVLSVKLLSKPNYSNVGIIGLGNIARATLDMLLAVEQERNMTIELLVYKDQAELFMKRFADHKNITFKLRHRADELIADSEVVLSSPTAVDSLLAPDDAFQPGVLVVPIHTRGFQNCDLFFDRVITDDIDHIRQFKYFSSFKNLHEICEIVAGDSQAGRRDNTERIIAYNIGISLEDIYFAEMIYRKIGASCADIPFEDQPKFWV